MELEVAIVDAALQSFAVDFFLVLFRDKNYNSFLFLAIIVGFLFTIWICRFFRLETRCKGRSGARSTNSFYNKIKQQINKLKIQGRGVIINRVCEVQRFKQGKYHTRKLYYKKLKVKFKHINYFDFS